MLSGTNEHLKKLNLLQPSSLILKTSNKCKKKKIEILLKLLDEIIGIMITNINDSKLGMVA